MNKLLIVGSLAYDSIQTPFGKVNKTLGGSASYFSLASSFFTKPQIVAVIGDDFKTSDFNTLKKVADVSEITKAKGKTFHWAGKYHFDLNTRDTLKTELGVFENFKPTLSPVQANSDYVFLGNTHPKLQMDVLKQVKSAKFVGLDTMNFWISSALKDLKLILKKVDCLIINDSEARELTNEHNVLKAAKKILGMMRVTSPNLSSERRGIKTNSNPPTLSPTLIIKRGEYGLLMFQKRSPSPLVGEPALPVGRGRDEGYQIFHLPGFPLEDVVDPTGAGDSFAGGFMGFITKTQNTTWENLKKACVAGSVLASFSVESLGTKALQKVTTEKITKRFNDFKTLTHFHS